MRRPGKVAAKQVVREQTRQQQVREQIRRAVNRVSTRMVRFPSGAYGGPFPTPEAYDGTRLWKQFELSWKELDRWRGVLLGWDDPIQRAYRAATPELPGHNFPSAIDVHPVAWPRFPRRVAGARVVLPWGAQMWLRNETRLMTLINALYDHGVGVDTIDPECPAPTGTGVDNVGEVTADQIEKMAEWLMDHPKEEEQYALDACAYMLALEWMMASAEALIDWVEKVDARVSEDPIVGKAPLPSEEWARLQIAARVFEYGMRGWY